MTVTEMMPGIDIAFQVEPLGMMFAALASGLWIINSIYSIGYMRGNREKNQTRFYVMFAVSLAATMGIAFSANLLRCSCSTRCSRCPPTRWSRTRETRKPCVRRESIWAS